MRAKLRFERLLLAGWMAFLATPALAQQTVPEATQAAPQGATTTKQTNTPATDAIGPRELQNFSLPGTVTQPSQAQPATSQPPAATRTKTAEPAPALVHRVAENPPPVRQAPATTAKPTASVVQQAAKPAPSPIAPGQASPISAPIPAASAPANLPATPLVTPAPEHGFSILPWLIAALALAGGTLFLLWRRRPREALAGGPELDLFFAPEPTPEPAPSPVRWLPPAGAAPEPPPRRKEPEGPRGIVATRLRPSLEIGVRPLRCLVEDSQVTIEFELDLFNSGAAPARAVFAEASLLNASATQDQELAAFFSRPASAGERLDVIPPMKSVKMTNRVVAPRTSIQEYELGGHKTFVPVIAFNALYEWSGGQGQTSAAYLVGREAAGDKLGPLRLDLGRREYRGLGDRLLPVGVRR
jgi:hypothetical protein